MRRVDPQPSPRQASPPTARVLAILESLAEEPKSLSVLARDVEISGATAHAILGTLAESLWVWRDERTRRYALGPTFLALAHRALTPEVAIAGVLRDVAAELAMPVSLSARHGDVLTVVRSAAPEGTRAPAVGEHVPYAVPFGPVFAAFDTAASQASWLQRSGDLHADVVEALEERLRTIREQGSSVERLGPSALRLVEVLQDARIDGSSASMQPLMQALLAEIVQSGLGPGPGRHPVSTIVVPVWAGEGVVAQTLNAHPFRSMTTPAAAEVAARLSAAASRLEGVVQSPHSVSSPTGRSRRLPASGSDAPEQAGPTYGPVA